MLQPLCDQDIRVFFYLDDLIVTAGPGNWPFPHSQVGRLEKECFPAMPTGGVSGSCARFGQSVGCSVRIQTHGPAAGSLQTAVGSSDDSLVYHTGVGANGGGPSSCSTGAPVHALPSKGRWFTSLNLDPRRHSMVNVPASVQEELCYWESPKYLLTGTLWQVPT